MVTALPKHLGRSYNCEYSQHTKSQPPTLPRSDLKVPSGVVGGGWVVVDTNSSGQL